MKNCLFVSAALSCFAMGSVAVAAGYDDESTPPKSTEYVLVLSNTEVATGDAALSIGRPLKSITVTEANGKCGYKSDGFGGYVNDTNYTGTSYGMWAMLSDSAEGKPNRIPAQTWVMGEDVTPGKKLTSWTVQYSGETCTETIEGTSYTFKKYSVSCDSCTAEE